MDVIQPGSAKRNWRLLLGDDHPLMRFGLVRLIEEESDLEVCGETGSIREAMQIATTSRPDLAIVDLSLSDGNGLDLIRRLHDDDGNIRILVCSTHDEILFAQRSIQAGAMGYINKHEATDFIISAIRQILDGKVWLSQQMIDRLLLGMRQGSSTSQTGPIDTLSKRELEVFALIGQGKGPSQIAKQLHISVKTIETHREKIKKKLNLRSGSELSRWAIQWNLDKL